MSPFLLLTSRVQEFEAEEYEVLRKFVHGVEKTVREERERGMCKAKGKSTPTLDTFVFFKDVMDIVHAEAGDATAWVLKGEENAWLNARKAGTAP